MKVLGLFLLFFSFWHDQSSMAIKDKNPINAMHARFPE
jgi:hypothetical protein